MHLIIDLEATCGQGSYKKEESEIIEIGAVLLDKDNRILGEYQTFIKPKRFPILSEFCQQLTSINQQDVDRAEPFLVAFKKFIQWVEKMTNSSLKDITFCSWGYYDKNQLIKDCQFHNIEYPFSTHRSLKHEFGEKRNIKPPGMKRALQICGIKLEGVHHRALDDVKNIAKIFIKEKMANYGKNHQKRRE
jgi:inhibitor of KinA sporulation pathway (predicted exonuclease)